MEGHCEGAIIIHQPLFWLVDSHITASHIVIAILSASLTFSGFAHVWSGMLGCCLASPRFDASLQWTAEPPLIYSETGRIEKP